MAEIKYGTDKELEELANELLGEEVGNNKRSAIRDVEKMSYELGLTDELCHYDPTNDWDTQDSGFAIAIDPSDLGSVEPSICADRDDGNVRAVNPKATRRRKLMRHVEDSDGWGPTSEDIPILGGWDVQRKTCARCKKSRALEYFSPDPRGKYGRDNWCNFCRKERMEQKRGKKPV